MTWSRNAKIAFIGSHGIRKTTAALAFASVMQRAGRSVEFAREVVRDNPLGINESATAEAQLWVLMSQVRRELELSQKAECVVTDRGVMDNFAYYLRACGGEDRYDVEPLVRAWSRTYDLVVRLTPDVAIRADGVRSTSDRFRDEVEAILDARLPTPACRATGSSCEPASRITETHDWWPLAEQLAARVGEPLLAPGVSRPRRPPQADRGTPEGPRRSVRGPAGARPGPLAAATRSALSAAAWPSPRGGPRASPSRPSPATSRRAGYSQEVTGPATPGWGSDPAAPPGSATRAALARSTATSRWACCSVARRSPTRATGTSQPAPSRGSSAARTRSIHTAALLGLAECRYRLDDEPAALQAWIAATQAPENPLTWRAWKALAAARVRSGDVAGAARAYREAARRAPASEQPELQSRIGWLSKELGDDRTARAGLRPRRARAAHLSPW